MLKVMEKFPAQWGIINCNTEDKISCQVRGRRWKGMMHRFADMVKLAARKSYLFKCQSTTENKEQKPGERLEPWLHIWK